MTAQYHPYTAVLGPYVLTIRLPGVPTRYTTYRFDNLSNLKLEVQRAVDAGKDIIEVGRSVSSVVALTPLEAAAPIDPEFALVWAQLLPNTVP